MTHASDNKSPRSRGNTPEKPDSEEWGFGAGNGGRSKAGKIGLMLAMLLVGAFAFVAYRRLHKQDDLVAQIKGMVDAETDTDEAVNPADSQSPPPRAADQPGDSTGTDATPDGSYRSRTVEAERHPADSSGEQRRSAFVTSPTERAGTAGSGSREPNPFSDSPRRASPIDASHSATPTDTRSAGSATSATGSPSDPLTADRTSVARGGTVGEDTANNPFGPQSEPAPATAATETGRADVGEAGTKPAHGSGQTSGEIAPAVDTDRSSPAADAGPRPFGSQIADRTPTGGSSGKPRSTEHAGNEFSNPWNSASSGSSQGTTGGTGGTGPADGLSESHSIHVADSHPRAIVGRADQGRSTTQTSADSPAASGTGAASTETSPAPWENRAVSHVGASIGSADPGGTGSAFSSSPSATGREVSDPFDAASPRSGGATSGRDFGPKDSADSAEPRPIAYLVKSGDNYWRISKKLYGTGRYFTALARYNKSRIPDPRRMRPGMQILVPSRKVLETRFPELHLKSRKTGGRTAIGARKRLPSGFFRNAQGDPLYRVGAHDTLSGIALRHLGRSSRWIQIRDLNRDRLPAAANLKIGTVLRLPADASQVQLVREPREVR